MKILDFLTRLGKKPDRCVNVIPPHDYGLNKPDAVLLTNTWGWTNIQSITPVILVNPEDCRDNINVDLMAYAWKDLGYTPWARVIARLFVEEVVRALNSGKDEADITSVFNRDYTAGSYTLSAVHVTEILKPWFDVLELGPSLKLRLRF